MGDTFWEESLVTETLIHRARSLLVFHTESEAREHLVHEGVTSDNAYLAVKAAVLLQQYTSRP